MGALLKGLIKPLRSRKVRVALTTLVVAFLAQWGLDLSDTMVLAGIGLGVSLILGIAHEDAGAKSAPRLPDDGS